MKRKLICSLLTLCCLACAKENNSLPTQEQGKIEVSFGQRATIQSRTTIGEDGYSAYWSTDDRIALWAADSQGNFELEAAGFKMHRFSTTFTSAYFTATIDPLTESSYTYYATSPLPKSVSGNLATFTLPAQQDGSSEMGVCDIMVARPTVAEALNAQTTVDLNLGFTHKMHAMRIVLQDDQIMQTPVDRIELSFPTAVVGDVTVDITDPTAPATLSNGSNQISVTIPEGYQAGDYIWVMLFPTNISGDITYRLCAGEYVSKYHTVALNKQVEAQHITPMSVPVPDPYLITTINIDITQNNLGEDYNTMTILDTQGNTIQTFSANEQSLHSVVIDGIVDSSTLSGSQYILRFESNNAIVEQKLTLPTIKPYHENTVPSQVPYLLFEDFSAAKAAESNDSYAGTTDNESDSKYRAGMLLNDYMSSTGWNAARFRLDAGNAIRINCRYQSGGWVVARYCGRLDTPALKAIKSGSTVNVKLDFDLGIYVPPGLNTDDTTSSATFYKISKHTNSESSALNGSTISDISDVVYTSDTFVSNRAEGSFIGDNIAQSVTINGCNSASRIAWWSCTNRTSSVIAANGAYYIYIDNIRVSIAQ